MADQTDVMITKCALTTAWRDAFALGAVYGEEELGVVEAEAIEEAEVVVAEEINWGADPKVAAYMRDLLEEINRLRPGSTGREAAAPVR